jgi:uncharacterized protein (DUF2062 family)
MLDFFRRRVLVPIISLLVQGISPRKIGLSIAIGLVVGIFPVLGTTTVLCTLAALALRLNLVAVHAVHYAVTPLQLLLIIPFVRLGEHILGSPGQPLSIAGALALVDQGVLSAVIALWGAIVHAVLAWIVVAPIAFALIYWIAARSLEAAARARARTALALSVPSQTSVPGRPSVLNRP